MSGANLKVGDITVTAVSDGELKTGLDCVLGLSHEECATLAGCAYEAPIWLPVNTFLIDLGGRKVLVDTGTGPNAQSTLGKLPDNLRALGTPPEAIETILLTHLHSDHANGLIDAEGKAVFPNADVILHQEESRFWLERDANDGDSERVRRTLVVSKQVTAPYRSRIRTVADGKALPGISAELNPGHTPGHTGWLIESGGERLLIWGDIVHLPAIQVPRPDAGLVYDVDPALAPKTRRQVFDRVAHDGLRVAGAHLPFPGFATVARHGEGYGYAPVG